jgi:hypothetical protein
MNYTEICRRIVDLSSSINDAFLIDSQSRLLAFKVREERAKYVDEGQFAERFEDLAFITNACKHYERDFDELEYVDISYKTRNTVVFSLGIDKILVICIQKGAMDVQSLAIKVSEIIHERTQIIED